MAKCVIHDIWKIYPNEPNTVHFFVCPDCPFLKPHWDRMWVVIAEQNYINTCLKKGEIPEHFSAFSLPYLKESLKTSKVVEHHLSLMEMKKLFEHID